MDSKTVSTTQPKTVAMVGAGARSTVYSQILRQRPELMVVKAVCDPDAGRRKVLGDAHGVASEMRFASHEELAQRPGLVDGVINSTGDAMHYSSTMTLLKAGYDMLLEKPIALREGEVREIIDTAVRLKRTVLVCHVLRYQAFYRKVKELLDEGAIGRLNAIYMNENVSYHHLTTTFVRNRRYGEGEVTPMLLQKCSHDMDLLAWFLAGVPAMSVASFASPSQFTPKNAPAGSVERCLNGCAVEETCAYSARRVYVEDDTWKAYAWPVAKYGEQPTKETKLAALRGDSPFGKCVWRCAHNVVDQQSVLVQFANGVNATFNMFCATARGYRTLHLIGTGGEIEGDFESGKIIIRRIQRQSGQPYVEEVVEVKKEAKGHSAGDIGLMLDFAAALKGEATSKGVTRIEDSLTGHVITFAADVALKEGRVVTVKG